MKPWDHAVSSVRKYGGKPEDYIKLHDWFDQTKAAVPDMRHRVMLHNAMGCYVAEQVFGHVITNSIGRQVPTRALAEQHIIEDLGFIPTLEKCFEGMALAPWMGGMGRKLQIVD